MWSQFATTSSAVTAHRDSSSSSSESDSWSEGTSPSEVEEEEEVVSVDEKGGLRKRKGLPTWSRSQLEKEITAMDADLTRSKKPVVLLLEGYAIECSHYVKTHPGGAALLLDYRVRTGIAGGKGLEADWAFDGGLNDHGWSAIQKMREMRIARISKE